MLGSTPIKFEIRDGEDWKVFDADKANESVIGKIPSNDSLSNREFEPGEHDFGFSVEGFPNGHDYRVALNLVMDSIDQPITLMGDPIGYVSVSSEFTLKGDPGPIKMDWIKKLAADDEAVYGVFDLYELESSKVQLKAPKTVQSGSD